MSLDHQLNIKTFVFNSFRENCYLLWDQKGNCVIVDPGCCWLHEFDTLKDAVAKEGLKPRAVWLTHGHFDHVHGVRKVVEEYGVPVLMAREDRIVLDHNSEAAREYGVDADDSSLITTVDIKDGDVLDTLDGARFKVIATPGHTPGGVCYYDEVDKVLLSGDTLFRGTIGRTDQLGGDYDRLIVSVMDKLMGLPGDVDVLPGHGMRTSIGDERTHNPFLQPFNESEEDPDWDGEGIEIHG
jgi:hydroxyacylglutathione hydrolase